MSFALRFLPKAPKRRGVVMPWEKSQGWSRRAADAWQRQPGLEVKMPILSARPSFSGESTKLD
jgi:hypothetical protein